ncbi:MAG: glycosyl hydrolase-related protein, partial [Eubacterium sp.]
EKEYAGLIPVEASTEENWWNDGWATTAYESGINKRNTALAPIAETMASLASFYCGAEYPCDDLNEMMDRVCIYNEHTWGYNAYKDCSQYHQQFEWKRSNALGANSLTEKTLTDSLKIMAENAAPKGYSIYVYNPLNWQRTDVVKVKLDSNAPKAFEIISSKESVPYEINGDEITFVAKNVPATGFKVFTVVLADKKPAFKPKTVCNANSVESDYFKLTFNDDGTVKSIIDKQNANREIVDSTADVKWNQYQYYDDFGIPFKNMGAKFSKWKWNLYQPDKKDCTIKKIPTAYGMKIEVHTGTFRAGSICQTITVYDDIPRIDIENKVLKSALPKLTDKEEAFYTFPFKSNGDYEIRYDLPIGNAAEGEQIYGTSRDWYTANKWVNVYDKKDDYSMTLALINTSLLQFGERRTGKWSFDYNSKKPYIFSYIMNNMWQTNFQGDQPGLVDFSYSLFANKGKSIHKINQSAWECYASLQGAMTFSSNEKSKEYSNEKSFLSISRDNVILSAMKAAEANAGGMIVRFNEIAGKETENLTVSFSKNITSYTETDIIENDIAKEIKNDKITFSLKPYEIKTFRIKTDEAVSKAENLKAVCTEVNVPRCEHYQKERVKELTNNKSSRQGVFLSWEKLENALFYEVFRIKNGKMYFVGSTKYNCLFDCQVTKDICNEYQYCVRGAGTGEKGELSEKVTPITGSVQSSVIFEKPVLYVHEREKNRIDLFWTPVKSAFPVSHYEIYRDGALIAQTTDDYITDYRDYNVEFNKCYNYYIKAVDTKGNKITSENVVVNHTDEFFANQDSPLAKKSKYRL